MNTLLSNGVFSLRLDTSSAETAGLSERLCRFLFPYLRTADDATPPDLWVSLKPSSDFEPMWKAQCVQPAMIRETYAEGFTLKVDRGRLADGRLVAWDEGKQVGYLIDHANRHVVFHGGASAFIHLIELVRYHGLLVEQAKGTAILHSSAVLDPDTGHAVAIAGVKGAGKTTTMLDRVLNQGWAYFSGDKLLLDLVGGRVRARGWPDFPHVGLGSLRQFPDLVAALGDLAMPVHDAQLSDQKKILLPPEAFADTVGRSPVGTAWLTEVILPEVAADQPLHHEAMTRADIVRTVSEHDIFEWPHTFVTSTWHGLPPADQALSRHIRPELMAALCGLAWTRARGRARPRPALAEITGQ